MFPCSMLVFKVKMSMLLGNIQKKRKLTRCFLDVSMLHAHLDGDIFLLSVPLIMSVLRANIHKYKKRHCLFFGCFYVACSSSYQLYFHIYLLY